MTGSMYWYENPNDSITRLSPSSPRTAGVRTAYRNPSRTAVTKGSALRRSGRGLWRASRAPMPIAYAAQITR